jgi:2-phosphosulfolactate phosphatase
MKIAVVLLPDQLHSEHLRDRAVVVFDVLRATTCIAAALYAGAREVRVFRTLDDVRGAATSLASESRLLCGEAKCLRPPGFDLGNSPGEFTSQRVRDRIVLLSTTNGTRALVAARDAGELYATALVNASATAGSLIASGRDVTLVCAGMDGAFAMEDVIGAGSVITAIRMQGVDVQLVSDAAHAALDLHVTALKRGLYETFLLCRGGQNVLAAGLAEDLRFAARVDCCPVVARCDESLTIRSV